MACNPEDLAMARRHVAEAEARIARQRALLEQLRADGQPTDLACDLLASMVEAGRQMQAHFEILERECADR